MPTPRTGETRDDFIKRCIPIVIEDGTAEDGKQAYAICRSMYDNKEANMPDEVETTVDDEIKEKPNTGKAVVASYIPFSAISFDDVEEFIKAKETRERIAEVTRQFESLSSNIMHSEDVDDKVGALKTLVDQLDGRLIEAMDLNDKSLFNTIKEIITNKLGMNIEDEPEQPKKKEGLFIWKEGDRYRWFAVYSNKYRDMDNPPEILSEKAHINFVNMVDRGDVPYPALWHWHIPGSRWGEADWLAYDKNFGFSLSSGFVDRGHEAEAKAIMELDEPLAVSHGLSVLKRNRDDNTIIDGYISEEISALPIDAAANKLTGFSLIDAKEEVKMIPEDKKQHLLSVGLTEERIGEIEADLEAKADKAEEEGLDFKEADTEEPEAETLEEEALINEPEAESSPEDKEVDDMEIDDLTLPATRQEVLEAIKPIAENLNELNEAITGLKKEDDEKIKEIVDDTPAFSIAALVKQNLSVIGKEETEAEKKDGPIENKSVESSITGLPWIDAMLDEER